MDELYEYLKDLIKAGQEPGTVVFVDRNHLYRLFQLVCFMKQIRGIINEEDDMWNKLRKIKERK